LQLPATPKPAAVCAHRDSRNQPVARAALVHGDVDDRHGDAVFHEVDLAVEQLGEDEGLARPPFEAAQIDATAHDHSVSVDARHLAHGDEHAAPWLHLDKEPEHTRRNVQTVHVSGHISSQGQNITLALRDKPRAGTGTITVGGGEIDIVRSADTIYVKGDQSALTAFGASSAQASLVAGKWLRQSV